MAMMIPPADIAWLWHCHRLAPATYQAYCTKRFGKGVVVEACPPFSFQWQSTPRQEDDGTIIVGGEVESPKSVAMATIAAWELRYPEEPFFPNPAAAAAAAAAITATPKQTTDGTPPKVSSTASLIAATVLSADILLASTGASLTTSGLCRQKTA